MVLHLRKSAKIPKTSHPHTQVLDLNELRESRKVEQEFKLVRAKSTTLKPVRATLDPEILLKHKDHFNPLIPDHAETLLDNVRKA